jgi:xanthine dehydrogenase YagS FAD-binding subunit
MKNFVWVQPQNMQEATNELKNNGAVLAGGIELLCLLKDHLITPEKVINLKSIQGMRNIEIRNGAKIGALVTLDTIQKHNEIRTMFRAIAQAAEGVASPQIRNVGTIGGNLCQRPRCWYFRDPELKCLKKGGQACLAVAGNNTYHAIFGSGPCYIVHPSDLAPALIAFEATIFTNQRRIRAEEFFVMPNQDISRENVLRNDEIVTEIEIPNTWVNAKSSYYKAKERPSFDWALASCAVTLKMNGSNVSDARIVLGGVAPIPWRSKEAEEAIKGKSINESTAQSAGSAAVKSANPMKDNKYKIKLTQNVIAIALLQALK